MPGGPTEQRAPHIHGAPVIRSKKKLVRAHKQVQHLTDGAREPQVALDHRQQTQTSPSSAIGLDQFVGAGLNVAPDVVAVLIRKTAR